MLHAAGNWSVPVSIELPEGSEAFVSGRLGKPFSERQLSEAIDRARPPKD